MRERFDTSLLDTEDPFEIDEDNRPHLFKHVTENKAGRWIAIGVPEIYDIYVTDRPLFYRAREDGPADWLMLGEVPGNLVLQVPLAPPRSGNPARCRPIGIYSPPRHVRAMYLSDVGQRGIVDNE